MQWRFKYYFFVKKGFMLLIPRFCFLFLDCDFFTRFFYAIIFDSFPNVFDCTEKSYNRERSRALLFLFSDEEFLNIGFGVEICFNQVECLTALLEFKCRTNRFYTFKLCFLTRKKLKVGTNYIE